MLSFETKMDITSFLISVFMFVCVTMNVCAFIALKRSRTLSPNIRILSMNLVLSNLVFCTVPIVLFLLGKEFNSYWEDVMTEDCLARLILNFLIEMTYLVTVFTVTAMEIDVFIAIVFPFNYLAFLGGNRMTIVCAVIWSSGFLVVLLHSIVNSHLIASCVNAEYLSASISMGYFDQNYLVIGITNFFILILNVLLFSSLLLYLKHKKFKERLHQISVLRKLSAIFVAYLILYGPFCIFTIFTIIIPYERSTLEPFSNISVMIGSLAFIVDPVLYAWRYKMCRLHMMRMVCFFRKTKVEKITRTLNEHYCTYTIDAATMVTSTEVWILSV